MRHDLEQIQEAGKRAAALTQQLLAFSRKQVHKPALVDLTQVVRSMEDMLHRLIGDDVSRQTVFDERSGSVWADRGQMEQVLMNLVVNSRDAMPTGGTIVIETRRQGNRMELLVSDTGCGMDAETQQHMFEPFFTTKPVGEGTGLGLPTVYGVVEQGGGTITVESAPGEGTTFCIGLPVSHERAVDTTVRPAAPATRGAETVLVVDDAEPVRTLTERVLGKAGFTVLAAANGFDALRVADQPCAK